LADYRTAVIRSSRLLRARQRYLKPMISSIDKSPFLTCSARILESYQSLVPAIEAVVANYPPTSTCLMLAVESSNAGDGVAPQRRVSNPWVQAQDGRRGEGY